MEPTAESFWDAESSVQKKNSLDPLNRWFINEFFSINLKILAFGYAFESVIHECFRIISN